MSSIDDPLLGLTAIEDRLREHGLEVTDSTVKNLWNRAKIPRKVILKKRYSRRSEVDAWVQRAISNQ